MCAKRIMDLFLTIPGVVLLLPVYTIIMIWIKIDSPGPVFFRQVRVGKKGHLFKIFKFRTMVIDAENNGKQITIGDHNRITRSGRFLRRYKLDELPQLFNVLKGDMSLVGPRPEVPHYVDFYPKEVCEVVLSVPPGITDFASIMCKDENDILGTANDPETVYIHQILPLKLSYYVDYVERRNIWLDLKLIFITIFAIIHLDFYKKKREQQFADLLAASREDISNK